MRMGVENCGPDNSISTISRSASTLQLSILLDSESHSNVVFHYSHCRDGKIRGKPHGAFAVEHESIAALCAVVESHELGRSLQFGRYRPGAHAHGELAIDGPVNPGARIEVKTLLARVFVVRASHRHGAGTRRSSNWKGHSFLLSLLELRAAGEAHCKDAERNP